MALLLQAFHETSDILQDLSGNLRAETKLPPSVGHVPCHEGKSVRDDVGSRVKVLIQGSVAGLRLTHNESSGAISENRTANKVVSAGIHLEVERAKLTAHSKHTRVGVLGSESSRSLESTVPAEAAHHEDAKALGSGRETKGLHQVELKTRGHDACARHSKHVGDLGLLATPVLDGLLSSSMGDPRSFLLVAGVTLIQGGVVTGLRTVTTPEDLLAVVEHSVPSVNLRVSSNTLQTLAFLSLQVHRSAHHVGNVRGGKAGVRIVGSNTQNAGVLLTSEVLDTTSGSRTALRVTRSLVNQVGTKSPSPHKTSRKECILGIEVVR
eukprot:Rmarinus@m.11984